MDRKEQIRKRIVFHRQINDEAQLTGAIKNGVAVFELDIRFTLCGEPVISHSAEDKRGKYINMSPQAYGRMTLRQAIRYIVAENPGNRVVIEIKELPAPKQGGAECLRNVKGILEAAGILRTTMFATLSPEILLYLREYFPNNTVILNGGICPFITNSQLSEKLPRKEWKIKFFGMELYISNSERVIPHAFLDGAGINTGYIYLRLPQEVVDVQKKNGACSLALVNMMTPLLPKRIASGICSKYEHLLHDAGIGIQFRAKDKKAHDKILTEYSVSKKDIFYVDTYPSAWK